jgi:hypothetical protein
MYLVKRIKTIFEQCKRSVAVAYTGGVFGRYDIPLEPYHILHYYRNIGKSITQYEI